MNTTLHNALRTATLTATAALLSISTLAATLAPFATSTAAAPRTAIVDLPRMVVTGHRTTAVAIVELPRMVVSQRRAVTAVTSATNVNAAPASVVAKLNQAAS